jgi:methionine-rich copper-binding protein CopC
MVGVATSAFAHALLVESTPASNSSVAGPNVVITLKFNVRIDAARSRLQLISPSGSSRSVPVTAGNASNVMLAQANDLRVGKYKLIWQVLASDGHITRGEVVFWVK